MNLKAVLKPAACLALVAFGLHGLWPQTARRHPPGVLVGAEPEQHLIPEQPLGEVHGFTLSAVATYAVQARVLHTKRYWADAADLVPYDVALGWGPMSDQAVLDQLRVAQSNRFFFYEWREAPPIPEKEIACHAANNHLIAASAEVAKIIRKLRAGQVVKLRGYLVNAVKPGGIRWATSLSRTDTGNGACELFYVESAQVEDDSPPHDHRRLPH